MIGEGAEAPPTLEELGWIHRGEATARLLRRVAQNRALLAGLLILTGFGAVAVAALVRYGASLDRIPENFAWTQALVPPGPSPGLWFGADSGIGIDVFDALFRATPIDLALVGGILLGAGGIGVLLGASGGLFGGTLDSGVVGVSDLLVGVPPFFFVLVLYLGIRPFLAVGQNPLPIFGLLFVIVLWPYYARPVRALAQRARSTPYAEAARAAGASPGRLLFRHVLPNSIAPALAQLPVDVYNVFFVLTVFPFLGCFGGGGIFQPIAIVPSPYYPEWGSLLGYGACFGWSIIPSLNAWWSYLFPAAFVVLFGFGVMLFADGMERHLRSEGPNR